MMNMAVWISSFLCSAFVFKSIVSFQSLGASRAFVAERSRRSFLPHHFVARKNNEEELNWPKSIVRNLEEDAKRQAIVEASLSCQEPLMSVSLAGRSELPTTIKGGNQTCLVLVEQASESQAASHNTPLPSLLLPLEQSNVIRSLESAMEPRELSPGILWRLNTLLVNRDGGLFDNMPWSTWSADPSRKNRDAAGVVIDEKFHIGKRDAYNVMLGKDTNGRSGWSVGGSLPGIRELAKKLSVQSENEQSRKDSTEESESKRVLSLRVLELQYREIQLQVAELDHELAVFKQAPDNSDDNTMVMEFLREELLSALEDIHCQINALRDTKETPTPDMLDKVVATISRRGKAVAPYRGATGYAPRTDAQALVATSPYDTIKQIIADQLKSNVIGCVLENTSMLGGTTTLGGALVLQRQTASRTVSLAGEEITVSDETEDFGNSGVTGGSTMVIECYADEAIGMALTCDLPLQVDTSLWKQAVMVQPLLKSESGRMNTWKTTDSELSVLVEGQARNMSATERVLPVRIPRSTQSLFDNLFRSTDDSPLTNPELFPTDNPIRSLDEYDRLTDEDKALTLLSLSNFNGVLPRPRVVRQASIPMSSTPVDKTQSQTAMNPLDELLLPLIDESVRRQYLLRNAENRGDWDEVQQLTEAKSRRQEAREKAQLARNMGQEDIADQWDKEADFLDSLRADVTQDEGSYSRFLDRDEWYERERQKRASKIDRKKFGTLLDGIE